MRTRLLAALIIVLITLVAYRGILLMGEGERYPWSSDTFGHLIKVEYLYQQLQAGNLYPEIFPAWYNGVQLLRYYGPLPYYSLAGLYYLSGDIFVAGNWFIFLAALLGGLSFLLYTPRIGLLPATLGGILFTLLSDNVRVALAEGNLPRVLATALLPLTFYFLLNLLDQGARCRDFLGLTLALSFIVLSHAMMAAIFAASMALFTLVYWILARSGSRAAGAALLGLLSGILLSGWWLLPSLTGGITELNREAASEALVTFPLTVSLNPWLRLGNKEIFYVGLSLALGTLLGLLLWRRLSPLARALLVAGVVTVGVSTTTFNVIFNSLPFHQLFWPIRFMSFAGFALLLGVLAFWGWLLRSSRAGNFLAIALLGALFFDAYPSLSLIFLRPADNEMVAVAEKLRELRGWRVATADLSLLGSAPSYLFTALGGREQVYGWAYQGTTTAPTVAAINFAMEQGYIPYALDRLDEMGADDIVLLKGTKIPPSFGEALEKSGYRLAFPGRRLELYHKDGAPRAFQVSYDILGIGEGAQNFALIFPQVAVGSSPRLDDYDLGFLTRFRTLVLSRFSWSRKARAEELVRAYASGGGRVIVDLTGTPEDVLAKEPKFLGVYGEPVLVLYQATLREDGKSVPLLPFSREYSPWVSYSPQGLDRVEVSFDYLGQEGVALGYKQVGSGQVTFLGLNLPFHALITKDTEAIALLGRALGVKAGETPPRRAVLLKDYRAGPGGYSFAYTLDEEGTLLFPMAHHDGTVVRLDGGRIPSITLARLIAIQSPAGRHQVEIAFERTPIYYAGAAASALALLLLLTYLGPLGRYFKQGQGL